MIAPRFEAQIPTSQLSSVTINLTLPDRLTEGLMQLLATFINQREFPFSPLETTGTGQQTQHGGLTPNRSPKSPAATRPGSDATGESSDTPATGPESLLGVYQQRMKAKRQRTATAETIGDHETSLKQFDAFCASRLSTLDSRLSPERQHRFTTPVLSLSETDILCAYSAHLLEKCSLSPVTVNRRLTHVVMVAKVLGISIDKPSPEEVKRLHREIGERQGVSPPSHPPESQHGGLTPNRSPEEKRRIPSFAEIDALARHVGSLTYPYGIHAPYFWRGWIRYLALFGPRGRDVVSTVTRKPGLKKADVHFGSLCPISDVNHALGYELHNAHGWLTYTIGKDHHSDCRRVCFPMPDWLRDWLRFFVEFSPSDRVFPATQSHSYALAQDAMSREWNSLTAAAKVDARLVPSEGTGGRIAIRKYAANWWTLATLRGKNDSALADKIGHYVLHHAEVTTSNKHYLSVQAAVLPTMLELLPKWPVPAADAPHVSLLPE